MPVRVPSLKFLNGKSKKVQLTCTPAEVVAMVKAELGNEKVDIYVDDVKMTDLTNNVDSLEKLYGKDVTVIYVQRQIQKLLTADLDKQRVNNEMEETLSPSHTMRGYTGHVPGKKYAHGLAECEAHKGHLQPQHVDETIKMQKTREDTWCTLGYSGFIPATQHVRGTPFDETVKVAATEEADALAKNSYMPMSPQKNKKAVITTTPTYLKLLKGEGTIE